MPVDPAVLDVIVRYGDVATAVRQRVLSYLQRAWGYLPSYNRDDIDLWVAQIAPAVEAGQVQIAALTDAYLASVESLVTGETVRPLGVPAEVVTAVRGVPTAEVYARTGPTVWGALKDGATLNTAVQQGLRRALTMGATDLQLAKTHASRHVLQQKDNVVGYRRVLSGSKSCGLCIVASTQRYHKKDLLPCHPGCDCSVAPIIGREDPGQVIEAGRLEDVHAAIDDRFGAFNSGARDIPGVKHPSGDPVQYRDVLVVHDHGEIGPVLGVRGQAFAGPDDIP